MKQGVFISFEGPDGAGKSTQIRLLQSLLEERGMQVLLTREPGGTRISEAVRALILDKTFTEMDPMAEALLYAAARAQLLAERIRPALAAGQVVICDRYVDSSLAYQGYGRGLGHAVAELNAIATGGLSPDLTFLLMLPPEAADERLRSRPDTSPDRLELEAMSFRRRVYEGYLALAAAEPERICLLDAGDSIEALQSRIRSRLEEFFHER
jgi:dTMP kinase